MEKRFDLSMLIGNACGCGYIDSKTFIGEDITLEDVKKFIRVHAVENKDVCVAYTVFEGSGMAQKMVCKLHSWIYK